MNYRKVIVDGHADTIQVALDEKSSINNVCYSFNLKDALLKLPYIQVLASFINPKYVDGKMGGVNRVNSILDKFYDEYKKNLDNIFLIKRGVDIDTSITSNKLGVVLSLENASAIEGDINNIEKLYNRGIRIMSLTWNDDNKLASGAHTTNDKGVTSFGKECIKKMNELNMLVDVSHISYNSFFDVIDTSDKCVIATHSNSRTLCDNPRNLTDAQIKEIANKKGIIAICYYSKFLSEKPKVSSDDIVNHIEYISNLVGVDYVGLGSDFDGIKKNELPCDISGVRDIDIIFEKLQKRGFSNEDINKISGGNFIRVLKENI